MIYMNNNVGSKQTTGLFVGLHETQKGGVFAWEHKQSMSFCR